MVAMASIPIISAFTLDQTARLTKVSARQLRSWADDGFFLPSVKSKELSGIDTRLYSFRDLVCLRVISALRNQANVPLQHLKAVKRKLSHLGDDMWAKTTLYVLSKRVVFDNPDTGAREDALNGQGVFKLPLQVVTGNMEEAVRVMRKREADSVGKIDIKKAGAKNPVIAGTRIPVRSIKDFHDAGYTIEQIIEQYPSLSADDVRAAINFRIAA